MRDPLAGLGGPGFPRPDIPLGTPDLPAGMARGVDLAKIRDKHKHQHRWILVANFTVADKFMAQCAQARDKMKTARARGEDPTEVEAPGVQLDQADLISIDGPGCAKCGLHWEHEKGYGQLCEMSDDDFDPKETITPVAGNDLIAAQMAAHAKARQAEQDKTVEQQMAGEVPDSVAPGGVMSFDEAMAQSDLDEAREKPRHLSLVKDNPPTADLPDDGIEAP